LIFYYFGHFFRGGSFLFCWMTCQHEQEQAAEAEAEAAADAETICSRL
jgi:hypothetical protein